MKSRTSVGGEGDRLFLDQFSAVGHGYYNTSGSGKMLDSLTWGQLFSILFPKLLLEIPLKRGSSPGQHKLNTIEGEIPWNEMMDHNGKNGEIKFGVYQFYQ